MIAVEAVLVNEDQLRTEYWEDNRTHPLFPLWIVFREIGHAKELCEGKPYVRQTGRDVPSILKEMETSPLIPQLAASLGIEETGLRALLWYTAWELEHLKPREAWNRWNHRVDQERTTDRRGPLNG